MIDARRSRGLSFSDRRTWPVAASFVALMEGAHLAGQAHHHKGLYIGLWFAILTVLVFSVAIFDNTRWGTQSAKKAAAARERERAERLARAGGVPPTVPPTP